MLYSGLYSGIDLHKRSMVIHTWDGDGAAVREADLSGNDIQAVGLTALCGQGHEAAHGVFAAGVVH